MTTTVSADIRVFCKAPGRKLTGLFHKINAYQTILLIRHNTHQIIIHIIPWHISDHNIHQTIIHIRPLLPQVGRKACPPAGVFGFLRIE